MTEYFKVRITQEVIVAAEDDCTHQDIFDRAQELGAAVVEGILQTDPDVFCGGRQVEVTQLVAGRPVLDYHDQIQPVNEV